MAARHDGRRFAPLASARWIGLVGGAGVLAWAMGSVASAARQAGAAVEPAGADTSGLGAAAVGPAGGGSGVWALFMQSFDFFTIVLVVGSIVAGAYIFRCFIEVRERSIVPAARIRAMRELVRTGRIGELRSYVEHDRSFVGSVMREALADPARDRAAVREAAELASAEQISAWFRRIEPLNVIGNLGPLVGLAGTVWGMVIAFATLGQAGGQAYAGDLAAGISKALFHTLLGLVLAIPCLLVYGYYRTIVDRHCTRALTVCAELIEALPGPAQSGRA